ncbi:hypothetical protein ACOMHN_052760 [Nucella lapillus]
MAFLLSPRLSPQASSLHCGLQFNRTAATPAITRGTTHGRQGLQGDMQDDLFLFIIAYVFLGPPIQVHPCVMAFLLSPRLSPQASSLHCGLQFNRTAATPAITRGTTHGRQGLQGDMQDDLFLSQARILLWAL